MLYASPVDEVDCASGYRQQSNSCAVRSSSKEQFQRRCVLLIPYVVLFLVVIFSRQKCKKGNSNIIRERIDFDSDSCFQPRRLSSDSLIPSTNDVVHLEDGLFGVGPGESLPVFFLRRLAALELSGPSKTLITSPLYGNIFNYAYYFVSILVGTPPQRQSVILDTGSSLLGFPCQNCISCGQSHIDKGFDLGKSSTAQLLPCKDARCANPTCSAGGPCPYYQGYSEGSSIEGNFFSDVVALGEENGHNKFVRFDYIGCHSRETNLFVTQVCLFCSATSVKYQSIDRSIGVFLVSPFS